MLRDILILNQVNDIISDPLLYQAKAGMAQLLKYALIVVSSAPFMIAYPFGQALCQGRDDRRRQRIEKGVLTGVSW